MLTKLSMMKSWLACKLGIARKEQMGGGEIVAVVAVIAIVVVLAVAFNNQITLLFNNLWSNITTSGVEELGK